jgi:hypothetical protein
MFRIQYALGTMLLAAAFGVTANAQQAYRGTFNLPFQTYWGGSVLEPGEYTVSIDGGTEGPSVLHVKGSSGTVTILTGPTELLNHLGRGRLVLANVNGVYAIQQFDAGAIGKSFSFHVPKAIQGIAVQGGGGGSQTSVITVR